MLTITINTDLYKRHNYLTNTELANLIKQKHLRTIDSSNISRALRGISKSYVVHYCLCDVLNLDLDKVFIVKNGAND